MSVDTDPPLGFPRGDEDCDFWVRDGAFFAGNVVVLPHDAMRLERFLSGRSAPNRTHAPRPRAAARRASPTELEAIRAEFPWALDDDEDFRRGHGHRRRARLEDAPALPLPDDVSEASDDDDLFAPIVAGVEEGAAEDVIDEAEDEFDLDSQTYFSVTVIGGRPSRGGDPDVPHGVAGSARRHLRDWCWSYGFPRHAEFSLRLYSRDAAGEPSRECCRRGDYSYRMWLTSGDLDFEFSRGHVTSCPPHDSWTAFILAIQDLDDAALMAAAERVQNTTPRGGL